MIHSLSGGIISENGKHTFVKVVINGAPYWYLSPIFTVKEGDKVLVPFGRGELPTEALVIKVEENTAQCAPVSMNRIKEIYQVL